MAKVIDRPEIVEDQHLKYLDELRESGATNMLAARPYVEREFGVSPRQAGEILKYWMHSFGERH